MPRLTDIQFLGRHEFLKQAWTDFDVLYAVLPVQRQWDVHAFYRPTEHLASDELLAHRRNITKTRPSLPQQAGKGIREMYAVFRSASRQSQTDLRLFRRIVAELVQRTTLATGKRQLTLAAVARPEPNLAKLVRVLIDGGAQSKRGASSVRKAATR